MTIQTRAGANPSVEELLIGVNASLASTVYLLPNDANVALAARELSALTEKRVVIVPTTDPVGGLAMLLRLAGHTEPPPLEELVAALGEIRSAAVFFAGKDARVDGVAVERHAPAASIGKRLLTAPALADVIVTALTELGAGDGGLVTLYYGGSEKERDAQKYAAIIGERFAGVEVQYYYGGQAGIEYWISLER